jgi:hypothetical protein
MLLTVVFFRTSLLLKDNVFICFLLSTPVPKPLPLDDLLTHADESTKCPFPGLFVYSLDMPVMILANVCTSMGIVNGAIGTTAGIVPDPSGISYINCFNVHATNFLPH